MPLLKEIRKQRLREGQASFSAHCLSVTKQQGMCSHLSLCFVSGTMEYDLYGPQWSTMMEANIWELLVALKGFEI